MATSAKLSDSILQHSVRVMEFIYRNRPVSRTKISDELQLKPATVTHIVNSLIQENKIFETGNVIRELQGSGRSRKLLDVNMNHSYLIGVEFTVRGIAIVATNTIGHILSQTFVKVRDFAVSDITQTIIQLITEVLNKHSSLTCSGIGLAIPGHFDKETQTIISNNTDWESFKLNKLTKTFSIPISIENNIECMALAEYLFDSQESPDKFLFLHSGPGIFCSFFDSNYIASKENYYIGELGHTIVDVNGPVCECGKRGCLQTYLSDTWLIDNAKFLFINSKNTLLKNLVNSPEEINLNIIIDAYTLGDPFIIDKIETGLHFLAISLSNTLIIYDSSKIFINSELLNKLDFKTKLINHIEEQLHFIPSKHNLDIEVLDFNIYRGARGACSLAAYHTIVQTLS